ncbi:MAG: methyltransferase domain-containing protein, partial [Deltaproteobacteria bacterium]
EQLQFDVIIMFHVIEHMEHEQLLEFMDSYLDLLLPGGLLIIATPVMTPYFYEDFDHVKPYLPSGILMVFGGESSQVQYYSKNKLRLLDLKYKKYFWRFPNYRSVYFPSLFDRAARIISALIYKFSFGLIGRVDGWLGVFQKQ